jgi:hypothetical protein
MNTHPWRKIQHKKDFKRWAEKNPDEKKRVEGRYAKKQKK